MSRLQQQQNVSTQFFSFTFTNVENLGRIWEGQSFLKPVNPW